MIVPQSGNYLPTMTSKTNLFRAELGEVTGRIPVTAAAEVAEAGAGLAATHSKDSARRGPSGQIDQMSAHRKLKLSEQKNKLESIFYVCVCTYVPQDTEYNENLFTSHIHSFDQLIILCVAFFNVLSLCERVLIVSIQLNCPRRYILYS